MRDQFILPDLCNVAALTLLVLFSQLLVVVLVFAAGEVTWVRLALMSFFVQWVAITSAGVLCVSRGLLARFGLVTGAVLAFLLVLIVTLVIGLLADRILVQFAQTPIAWQRIAGQLVIAGLVTAMVLRYFYVQQRLRQQEQAELQSRIQALQSRIRPHFLFNSMNIIASLISVDPDTAERVVEDLSELFRASLNETGNRVPVKEELALCERYVRIEGLRLGERLKLDWQVEPLPDGAKIPLLTLQPLLENAIYHGIQPQPDGGTVAVRIWQDGEAIRVLVRNPLPPADAPPSPGNRMALDNIRSRLEALYGSRAGLSAEAVEAEYRTSLHFPLQLADGA